MVISKILNNYPINFEYVTNTHTILGPALAGMQGKIVIHRPDRVKKDLIQIPRDFHELQKVVTLTTDVMFVNGIALCISKKIGMYLYNRVK